LQYSIIVAEMTFDLSLSCQNGTTLPGSNHKPAQNRLIAENTFNVDSATLHLL